MKIAVGENIKRLRFEKEITQEDLSVAINVSAAAVSKWETGDNLPDITLLPLLAQYFGVSIDALMGYDSAAYEAEIDSILVRCDEMAKNGQDCFPYIEKAHGEYPNDFRITRYYLLSLTGGMRTTTIRYSLGGKTK